MTEPISARWKPMDVIYQDTLRGPRCLVLAVYFGNGQPRYECFSEGDGNPGIPETSAMTLDEWLQWLTRFRDDLTGREYRECKEAAEATFIEPKSWTDFRCRYAETGDPWLQ